MYQEEAAIPQTSNRIVGLTQNTMSGQEMNPKPLNTIRPIRIEQLSHGYVVQVGCQNFAIESASMLIAKLSEYILNPAETESKHEQGKFF